MHRNEKITHLKQVKDVGQMRHRNPMNVKHRLGLGGGTLPVYYSEQRTLRTTNSSLALMMHDVKTSQLAMCVTRYRWEDFGRVLLTK